MSAKRGNRVPPACQGGYSKSNLRLHWWKLPSRERCRVVQISGQSGFTRMTGACTTCGVFVRLLLYRDRCGRAVGSVPRYRARKRVRSQVSCSRCWQRAWRRRNWCDDFPSISPKPHGLGIRGSQARQMQRLRSEEAAGHYCRCSVCVCVWVCVCARARAGGEARDEETSRLTTSLYETHRSEGGIPNKR